MIWPQERRGPRIAGPEKTCLGGHANPTSRAKSEQRRLDVEREQRIDELRLELLSATTPDARRAAWNALRNEIATRSPAQIARMERARGLDRRAR